MSTNVAHILQDLGLLCIFHSVENAAHLCLEGKVSHKDAACWVVFTPSCLAPTLLARRGGQVYSDVILANLQEQEQIGMRTPPAVLKNMC